MLWSVGCVCAPTTMPVWTIRLLTEKLNRIVHFSRIVPLSMTNIIMAHFEMLYNMETSYNRKITMTSCHVGKSFICHFNSCHFPNQLQPETNFVQQRRMDIIKKKRTRSVQIFGKTANSIISLYLNKLASNWGWFSIS